MSTEKKLMNAAIDLMSVKGYHHTTVADIVNEAGVAQGTFYNYFESKKAMFTILIEKFYDMIENAMLSVNLEAETAVNSEDFARQIQNAIRNVLLVYQHNAALAGIFLREAISLEPGFAKLWESIIERLVKIGSLIMDKAIEQNFLPDQNSPVVALCVVGMIERVAYYWLFHENDFEIDDLVIAISRFELYGITQSPKLEISSN